MLDVALKEWAIVCDLLLAGDVALLLRKGGIHERGGPGVFRLEHPKFALFPSWSHQRPRMIKHRWCDRAQTRADPDQIILHGLGLVSKIWQVPCRAALDAVGDLHCWTAAQIDVRFEYKPDRPLFLLAVRARRLREPKLIANVSAYRGCRSWVALRPPDRIDDQGARPILDDAAFNRIVLRVEEAMVHSR